MCEKAVENEQYTLKYVLDHLKTEDMCKKAIEEDPHMVRYVPDHLKTQEMTTGLLKNLFLIIVSDMLRLKMY